MITTLYRTYQDWSADGSVYLYSDPHFDDDDCKYMDPDWPDPDEHVAMLNKKLTKKDTLILLGDIGDISYNREGKMRNKRGKDHIWEIRKYAGDITLYAHCKCGFQYACSHSKRNQDGSWSLEQEVGPMYPYCPWCGTRKKKYISEEEKSEERISKPSSDRGEVQEHHS